MEWSPIKPKMKFVEPFSHTWNTLEIIEFCPLFLFFASFQSPLPSVLLVDAGCVVAHREIVSLRPSSSSRCSSPQNTSSPCSSPQFSSWKYTHPLPVLVKCGQFWSGYEYEAVKELHTIRLFCSDPPFLMKAQYRLCIVNCDTVGSNCRMLNHCSTGERSTIAVFSLSSLGDQMDPPLVSVTKTHLQSSVTQSKQECFALGALCIYKLSKGITDQY